MTRATRHFLLAAASTAAPLAAAGAAPAGAALDRMSLMLAWLCLLYFTAVLLVGPAHVLRTGRLVTNHLLRRDLGIWCAVTGLAHLALSFKISMTPLYMQLYIDGAGSWPAPAWRRELYKWGVIGSLVIAVVFLMLLALSNNASLRRLGPAWWKRLQRLSYPAFVLTVAHGVVFQLIESRTAWLWAALLCLTGAVTGAQLMGWSRLRGAGQARDVRA
jgi:DMSO/TMAO reductase YedYZ heme-binding membrane subunit